MKSEHLISNGVQRTSGRFVRCVFGIIAAAVIFSVADTGAQSTDDNNSAPNYHSFDIITTRNIFDPNRRPYRTTRYTPSARGPDSFALVGTMSYSKGKFAFFDSSLPEYKKVLGPGATIAGYTVKDITPKNVILTANSNEVSMNVGARMLNEGPGKWKLSTDMGMSSTSDEDTQSSTGSSDLTPPAGASPGMSDVLKKLMERKQQELQELSK